MNELEPPYRAIWRLLKQGQIIPVLGAGASLSGRTAETSWTVDQMAYLPSGNELSNYLGDAITFPADQRTDLAKVAQYFQIVMGRPLLRQWLRNIFVQEYPHASVHELLAEVPAPLLILTTNYDDLIERAFRAKGRPFDLVIYPSDNEEWGGAIVHWKHGATKPEFPAANRLYIQLDQTTVIYKMHGAVDRQDAELDSFVIDEDDYSNFLVRIAEKKAIPAIFANLLRTRYFLFLGYSLRDWNFRVILRQIEKDLLRTKGGRLPSWAIQKNCSALERKLWENRNVTIYDMELQEFVHKIRSSQEEHT